MIAVLLQSLSGRTEEYLENMLGSSVFRSRFEPGTPITQSEAKGSEIIFRVSCCRCLRMFLRKAANIEGSYIYFVDFLGSTGTSSCRSHHSVLGLLK